MHIGELHLELSRNCTLECEHCLRGDRQKVCMDSAIIEETFKNVKSVDRVLLTGGEPLIAIQALEKIAEVLYLGKAEIKEICIITNGTVFGKRIINVLRTLDKYTHLKFRVSADVFHHLEFDRLNLNDIRNNNLQIMKNLHLNWNFSDTYGIEDEDSIQRGLLKQGRAANLTPERLAEINAISRQEYIFLPYLDVHPYTVIKENFVDGNITIDVYGNLVSYGQTFEAEDIEASETKLNIMLMPFEEAVKTFIKIQNCGIDEIMKEVFKEIREGKHLSLKQK